MIKTWMVLPGLAALLLGTVSAAPLLLEGKSAIYQRILTTPSCVLRKDPSDKAGQPVDAFSRYYVYGRLGGC